MSYIYNIRYAAEECRTLAAASISATYQPLVSASSLTGNFLNPIRQIFIQNLTNGTVWISFDYRNAPAAKVNAFPLPAGGYFVSDICTNKSQEAPGMFFSQVNGVWVKQFSGAVTGDGVYLAAFYAEGNN